MDIEDDVFASFSNLLSTPMTDESSDEEDGERYGRGISRRATGAAESLPSQLEKLLAKIDSRDPLAESASSEPCLPDVEDRPFVIQEMPGKGHGVLADRRIPAGAIILSDPFVISIQEPAQRHGSSQDARDVFSTVLIQLLGQYVELPVASRRQLASLHAHVVPESHEWFVNMLRQTGAGLDEADLAFLVRLYFTFTTNEFSRLTPSRRGAGGLRRLFLATSRINHSCRPNAKSTQTTDGYKVVTTLREIQKGEEITLRYLSHHYYTREDWQQATQHMWGFVCNCGAC